MPLPSLLRSGPSSTSLALVQPGAYLTDGRTLFRVISQFTTAGDDAFASLEDCVTLDVKAYAPGELAGMSLRHVQTSG